MDVFLQQFQHLKIQLEDITSATNNFDNENCIGRGGFGKVYKGEVSHSKGRNMVAIKRLDRRHGQGTPEFLKEITMLSRYKHDNVISFIGFCYQGEEMILVYEHASRGSLDRYLNSPYLEWPRRLKICLDAAKGLSYLHDPRETHQRLIHCDMKSANILLDDQWNAKVSDFGLSIMGPANEQQSVIVTNAAGTLGYCDPQYAMTHTLTKESDVYSFGVVLFEVLCGTLCSTYRNGRVEKIFVPTWVEAYKQNKLDDIIFKNPTIQPMDKGSLKVFSDIAYRCLKGSREDRPNMAEVVRELETALEIQKFSGWEPPFDYEEMTKTAEPTLDYRSKGELRTLLSKGVLLNAGKTWFSLNKKGEHCEMVSFAACLDSDPSQFQDYSWSSEYNSRFPTGTFLSWTGRFKIRVKSQFLSPQITYTVNLVFKFRLPKKARKCHDVISIAYKLQEETKFSISYLAVEREDEWYMAELYQFTSNQRIVDLEIQFRDPCDDIEIEGIEFRPLEKEDENETLKVQPILDSDSNWEEKIPIDYEDISKLSKNSVQWTTEKELYSIFRKGFLINDGQEWFSIDKTGKKCHMLSARMASTQRMQCLYYQPLPESRFGEVVELMDWEFKIITEINHQLVSSKTTYASYLVYKLPRRQPRYEAPMKVMDEELSSDHIWFIFLASPQTPVIRPMVGQNTHNPLNRPKIKDLPQQRNDGWMEVKIWEFHTATPAKMIPMRLKFNSCGSEPPNWLLIQGVEFRPV